MFFSFEVGETHLPTEVYPFTSGCKLSQRHSRPPAPQTLPPPPCTCRIRGNPIYLISSAALIPQIKTLMENAAQLSIPLIVDTGLGANWDEAH